MNLDAILDTLDPEQRAAVLAPRTPLLIAAGAGTGKTRTAIARIAHGVAAGHVDPTRVLALTHSTKAAGEMRTRLQAARVPGCAKVTARTFHAAALRQLTHFWVRTGRPHELRLLDSRYSAVRGAIRHLERTDPDTATVIDVTSEIGWAKSQMCVPADYPSLAARFHREPPRPPERLAEIFARYEAANADAGLIDFEDLLRLTGDLIEADAEVAAQVYARYNSFTVDEFQDTDPLQARLLRIWQGASLDLTVVGDVRQSIYRFRGADASIIENFERTHPGARRVELVRDYRSTPQVVALANKLASEHSPIQGMRPSGPIPALTVHADEQAEATAVAALVASRLAAGVSPAEIAILYRFNAQSAPFEQALEARAIPYQVADTDRFFDRPEIREACDRLRTGVARLAERFRAEWGPGEAVSAAQLDAVMPSGLECLRETLRNVGFDPANPPPGTGAARDRFEAHAALLRLCAELPEAEMMGAHALASELHHRRSEQMHAATATVTLATLHKAKGLEWDVVCMPRLTEGSLPSTYATTPPELAEERRLAYVGITRARTELYLSHARSRDGRWASKPSRFLVDLGLAAPPAARASRPTSARPTSARPTSARTASRPTTSGTHASARTGPSALSSRTRTPKVTGPGVTAPSGLRTFGTCTTCASPLTSPAAGHFRACTLHLPPEASSLFERLRVWRAAEAGGRPAYTVLPDGTLLALIQHRPTTLEALTAIPGIGTVKRARLGPVLLALLAEQPT